MTMSNYSTKPVWAGAPEEGEPVRVEGALELTEWQRVWFRTQSRNWRTLALVPADDSISTFEVAHRIAKMSLGLGEFIHVADVRDLRPRHVDAFLDGTRWDAAQGDRIIFATRPASDNLATVRLARAADCAILCVSIGSTAIASVRETVEQIGRENFLGSLLVRVTDPPTRRRHAPVEEGR
jgi:hypothetical protein